MAKKLTQEQFIEKAIEVHGIKYDYSNVNYINTRTKIVVICKIHGEFQQAPQDHIQGKGCSKCASEFTANLLSSNTKEFIFKSKQIHMNFYDYTKTNYINAYSKVAITCPIHGDFEQKAMHHLQGCGCKQCGIEASSKILTSNTKEFINKANIVHNTKYDYNLTNYVKEKIKVIITCLIHGEFKQSPDCHLQGQGCPSCAKYGFDPSKPGYLYYLKITTDTNQVLYKIGITNKSVKKRFRLTDLAKIEIVKQKLYDNGQDALDWETKLKRMYKEYQYKGPNILSSGNTELFTEDIMNLYSIAIY